MKTIELYALNWRFFQLIKTSHIMRLINDRSIKYRDFFYVLILFLISGNPEVAWQWNYVVIAFLLILLYNKLVFDNSVHYRTCIQFMVVAFVVFMFQFIVFGWNSFPAIINFCSKVFCAYGAAKIIGDKFRETAFNVIYFFVCGWSAFPCYLCFFRICI